MSNLATDMGLRPHLLDDAAAFPAAYKNLNPQLVLYEYFMDRIDGVEAVQYLIEQENTARVILTASQNIELTKAATILVEDLGTFEVTILALPASNQEIAMALKGLAVDFS